MRCRDVFQRWLRALPGRLRLRRPKPHVEQLEARNLLSAYPLSPVQVRNAYGFDQLNSTGAGETIGIVDAYADPNIGQDLDTFDKAFSWSAGGPSLYSEFGPSTSVLTVATSGGKTSANPGWAQETSLDVEWAHAIAPAANILLVEAKSDSISDLLTAVDYASTHGAQVVSMSWGTPEFAGETAYDSHFQQPGVTYIASSGDSAVPEWPAVSPNVVSVGGTALSVKSSGAYLGETGWNGSGGGISAYEPKPGYQSGVTQSATQRTVPDVAFNADPYTGFWVYDSYRGGGGWGEYGGTSAGAPQWAGLIALADQGRATPLSSADTLNAIYSLSSTPNMFHGVTSGGSGANSAGPGYNLVTGVGSPVANNLVAALSGSPASAASVSLAPIKTIVISQPKPPSSGGHTTDRIGEIFFADILLLTNNSGQASLTSSGSSAQSGAQATTTPAFMTQIVPAATPEHIIYLVGDSLDQQDGDVSDDNNGPPGPPVPAYSVQLSACYTETPVVERKTWGEAVGTVCDHDFYESKEMYPARTGERREKRVAPDKSKSLAAGFLMAGAAVAFGTPRQLTNKRLTDEAWRYWKKPPVIARGRKGKKR